MPVTKTIVPSSVRWEYSTEDLTDVEIEEIRNYAAKWLGEEGDYFQYPRGRLDLGSSWVCKMLSVIPESALDEIARDEATLWIDIEHPDE